MSKQLKAHLAVFVVNLIYGLNFTIAKGVMPTYIKPLGFVTLRVSIAYILFAVIHRLFIREKIDKSDIPLLALCGLFGVAMNQMLFFMGLSLTTPINGAIIMTTNPILVLITAAILLKERITGRKIAGITLGLAGAIILLTFGKSLKLVGSSIGDLYIFINAMSYGIFLVIVKPLMKKYKPITVIKWTFFFGSIMVIPFGIAQVKEIQWSGLSSDLWLAIGYVVLMVTFVAYLLNTIALKTLSPSVVSFYIYLQPLFATLISLILGKDHLTGIKIASSLLIFIGVYLVSLPAKEKI